MKNKDWLSSMSDIDPKWIEEADPTHMIKTRKTNKNRRGWLYAVAAAGVLLMFLLWPTQDTNLPPLDFNYSGPEYNGGKIDGKYSALVEKIEAVKSQAKLRNEIFGSVSSFDGITNGSSSSNTRIDITDNQEAGVEEANLIARTNTHIFYLYKTKLKVYTIQKINSTPVAEIEIPCPEIAYPQKEEFYLSADGRSATVIHSNISPSLTYITKLDLSDLSDIKIVKQVFLRGEYQTSRVANGELLLMSSERLYSSMIDYTNPETYVPWINDENGKALINADDIILPEKVNDTTFLTVFQFDDMSLTLKSAKAFFSYYLNVYVTTDRIYVLHSFFKEESTDDPSAEYTQSMYTEISSIAYDNDSLSVMGSITVPGSVRNQYSVDEQNGILRVATTLNTEFYQYKFYYYNEVEERYLSEVSETINSALYCIDMSTWQIVAKVENFAPDGEEVVSARFEGDKAYICTAVMPKFEDPVYCFDLSDLSNITYVNTEVIDGYSHSLVDFGNGNLIGIGVGDSPFDVKIEAYKAEKNQMVSTGKIEIEHTFAPNEYKSYYIDRENQLIGFGIYQWNSGYPHRYVLIKFNGNDFTVVADTPLGERATDDFRGVVIDGYLYCFGEEDFKVVKLP